MINTILFDLDGTLLPINTEDFLQRYFYELGVKFKDYFSPQELSEMILASTYYSIKNNEVDKTNETVFFEDFFTKTSYPKETIIPIFEDFYENDFRKIKDTVQQNQFVIKAIEKLKKKGYSLVVATNPIFPKSAVVQRLHWAGLDEKDFQLLTSFEMMHHCKPKLEYYNEILTKVGKSPDQCMMVGNDVEEDMIAKKLGIQTYLIEDYMISRNEEKENIDFRGNYEAFYSFVDALPSVK
ncbi:HAD family hydrolase [Alkaliphilus transvaalensis]|uniref:HAD family hydrolase n=1 Tax=Alkaliphilus transvaalensis TaxID=114628 RepID=UPI00047DB8E1|nr:HAD family hydrolase [Alkaliphilus transvaalensis]